MNAKEKLIDHLDDQRISLRADIIGCIIAHLETNGPRLPLADPYLIDANTQDYLVRAMLEENSSDGVAFTSKHGGHYEPYEMSTDDLLQIFRQLPEPPAA